MGRFYGTGLGGLELRRLHLLDELRVVLWSRTQQRSRTGWISAMPIGNGRATRPEGQLICALC